MTFLIGRLRKTLRRHLVLIERGDYAFPLLKILARGAMGGKLIQVDSGGSGGFPVALEAVFLEGGNRGARGGIRRTEGSDDTDGGDAGPRGNRDCSISP